MAEDRPGLPSVVAEVRGSVAVAATTDSDTLRGVTAFLAALEPVSPKVVLVFHSPRHDPAEMARAAGEAFPDACTAGCTSAGEIGPNAFQRGGMSAIALGGGARGAVSLVPARLDRAPDAAPRLVAGLAAGLGRNPLALSPDRQVFVTLTDGLVGGGEDLLARLGEAAPGMPIVGGSAGDDDRLEQTFVWADGVAASAHAVVLLLEPGAPFTTFALHHFRPTSTRVVVTRASPSLHRVHELDGFPAVQRFASLVGVSAADLDRGALLTLELRKQLGFLVGEDLYMRGLLSVDGDDLILGGAVEEGMVLRLAEAGDLVGATRQGVTKAIARLPGRLAAALHFNCVGRLIQCREGDLPALHHAASAAPMAGFSTLGEQFGPLQVNYTLAGLLLGEADLGRG